VIYSALLELQCPIRELAEAAGLPEGATFGQIILSLMDQLAAARKNTADTTTGFKTLPLVSADSVLTALAVEKLLCCEQCAARLTAMTERWRLAGIVQPEDPPEEGSVRRVEERLLN
jgi:hypothetical protein